MALALTGARHAASPPGAFVATTFVKHYDAPYEDGRSDGGAGAWYKATNCLSVAPDADGGIGYELRFELPDKVKCGLKGHAAPDGAGVWTDLSQGCEITFKLAGGRWSVSEGELDNPRACSKTRCRDAGFFVDTFEPSEASPGAKCVAPRK